MELSDLGKPINAIAFPSSLLNAPANKMFIMEATGENMEPCVKDKDLLFCVLDELSKPGDIVILWNGSEAEVKFKGESEKTGSFYYNAKMKIFDLEGYKEIAKVKSIYSRKI